MTLPSPTALRIPGRITSGCGKANLAFTDQRQQDIYGMMGWEAYPGTLNVKPDHVRPSAVVAQLGRPLRETEHDTKIGPLQWWSGRLVLPDQSHIPVLLVRGVNSGTGYLEFVAQLCLSVTGPLQRNDQVFFIPHERSF